MRILLINPPHPSIGSRVPREHLPPLGLLSVAGPLLDAGHDASLLDAEFGPMPLPDIAHAAAARQPDLILIGHSGSTSAHPIVRELSHLLKRHLPNVPIIYGGVFPTYHWREVLSTCPHIDYLVRGEGERTTLHLITALDRAASGGPDSVRASSLSGGTDIPVCYGVVSGTGTPVPEPSYPSYSAAGLTRDVPPDLSQIPGIAYRTPQGLPTKTPDAPMIHNLDACRVAWELIDHSRYSYWGDKRAVVIQFSRGCPHLCNYCGQRGFWTRFRHRDPHLFAREIARLHRDHGVEVFNLADENPTASRSAWKAFLHALIAENVPDVILVGSTRADDIVRDADILHLYKQAGCERFLMGMESYDEATLKKIKKGGTPLKDRQAIQLLRRHGILSMATWVVGFEDERIRDYFHGLRQLLAYDPDQVQMLYVTPHRWTPIYRDLAHRRVLQPDARRWDYKHQVLTSKYLPPFLVLAMVKLIEVTMQMRPRALYRLLTFKDPRLRSAQHWYYRIGRKVWFYEIFKYLTEERPTRTNSGPTLSELWGAPQDHEETPLSPKPTPLTLHRRPLPLTPSPRTQEAASEIGDRPRLS